MLFDPKYFYVVLIKTSITVLIMLELAYYFVVARVVLIPVFTRVVTVLNRCSHDNTASCVVHELSVDYDGFNKTRANISILEGTSVPTICVLSGFGTFFGGNGSLKFFLQG